MKKLNEYSGVLALAALVASVAALCVGGAVAGSVLVGSKQIRNGSILTQDIHKAAVKASDIGTGAVRSADLQNGAVQSADIGNDQVEPANLDVPPPAQLKDSGVASITPTLSFARVDVVGIYSKEDPASVLEVDWTGSVRGENGGEASGCVFQLRVDGQPAPAGGGEVFARGLASVSAAALFPGLGPGPHQIEVWARMTIDTPSGNNCTVGPAAAGVGQTVVVSEQVV